MCVCVCVCCWGGCHSGGNTDANDVRPDWIGLPWGGHRLDPCRLVTCPPPPPLMAAGVSGPETVGAVLGTQRLISCWLYDPAPHWLCVPAPQAGWSRLGWAWETCYPSIRWGWAWGIHVLSLPLFVVSSSSPVVDVTVDGLLIPRLLHFPPWSSWRTVIAPDHLVRRNVLRLNCLSLLRNLCPLLFLLLVLAPFCFSFPSVSPSL